MLNYELLTEYGERLDRAHVLPEYPRPQFRRDSYLNLNGVWRYAINKTGELPAEFDGDVVVPFPIESCLSGVRRTLADDEWLIYSRDFEVPADFICAVTLLHLDAADNFCEVTLNGVPAGSHTGGYLPAEFDVSASIRPGRNTLTVRVKDGTSYDYPTGKQRKQRGGIWYTPVSGLWQSVWLESVCAGYIKSARITPDVRSSRVTVELDGDFKEPVTVTVLRDGQTVCEVETRERRAALAIPDAHLWSPQDPFLYDLRLRAGDDTVSSYFAMREFKAEDGRFFLNGEPYFVNGLLDQGYFSDGIYTPASYEAFRDDIARMKELGFNALRKHIKLEPMLFYYYCDTLGMLVLQDMVNLGKYSFLKDTALPFSPFAPKRLPYVNVNKKQRAFFAAHALETVAHLYNCPCVVYYTIFNEGWGQFDGDAMYTLLKEADPTRVYDATSGWYRQKLSDVESKHIYFKPIKLEKEARTVIVSEFGGYAYACAGHLFNPDREFGYRQYADRQAFEDGFVALYENEILGNLQNGLAGAIYTQVSDVEDELNGLLSYDRRVCKLDAARIRPLMERICAAGGAQRKEGDA